MLKIIDSSNIKQKYPTYQKEIYFYGNALSGTLSDEVAINACVILCINSGTHCNTRRVDFSHFIYRFFFLALQLLLYDRALEDMKQRLRFLRRRHTDSSLESSVRPSKDELEKWAKSFLDLMSSRCKLSFLASFL